MSTDRLLSNVSSPSGVLYDRKTQGQSSLSCKRLENGHGPITPLRIHPPKAQQAPRSPICKELSVKLTDQRTHSTQKAYNKGDVSLRPGTTEVGPSSKSVVGWKAWPLANWTLGGGTADKCQQTKRRFCLEE